MKIQKINIFGYADTIKVYIHRNAYKVLNILEKTQYKDYFSKPKIYIESFYNKFLPKFLRNTQKVELFPETNTISTRQIRNYKKVLIRYEQFDINGQLIYLETYNPLTKKGVVQKIKDGIRTETIFCGDEKTQCKKYNSAGKLISSEKFNPKQTKNSNSL